MANVIREDVVKLGFEIEGLKELQKLQKEVNDLKKKLTGGIGEDSFDDLKKGADEAVKPLKKVKEQAEKVVKSIKDIGKKAATTAFNGLKKLAGISFKALSVGVTAVATALGGMVTKSVQAFGEFEQLQGGVKKLFGAGGKSIEDYAKLQGKSVDQVTKEYNKLIEAENTVFKNANDAYKTAGMSANQYMETVSGIAASLKSGLGGDTQKAAEVADMAIQDMADNANTFGTSLEKVRQTYDSLSRGNYQVLDNLRLGFKPTKEGMQDLIKKGAELDKSIDANDTSYANLVKAIHAVQQNMQITGTTHDEAKKTITGSLNAMKATWSNLLTAMGSGENIDQRIGNMVDAAETFAGNVMPVAERALGGLGTVIEKLVPIITEKLPPIAEKLLPPLIKAAVQLTKGLIAALPSIIKTLATTIVDIFGEQFPIIEKIGNFFKNNAGKIADSIKIIIPTIIALSAAFKGFKAVKGLTSLFGSLKGGKGGSGEKGGVFGSLTSTFKELAKTKTTTILKGMANLAIILGGFLAMSAILLAVAPIITQIGGFTELLKLCGVMLVLGIVSTALAKFGEIAGKIQVGTVAKGLANMAIMLAGMSALFLLVGAVSLINFDLKRVLGIALILGVLGTIGAALVLFGAICGIIPVPVVALGLANMAIMLAGMSALFLLLGAVSLINFDLKRILKIAGVITVIGAVGTALAIFGGIAGIIPFPIVLQGLTNIGLVFGGMAALMVAFGELTRIKGFTEFLEKGGQVLVKIMNILGEMVGALAGGLIEGLSSCLPALGENLGKFGENIKPLFTSIAGVDMAGVGAFFTSLVGLLGIATGNEIIQGIKSFFGGEDESALSKLGTDLCNFATNAQGFFNTVAGMKPEGFSNAKLLFESLASMKSLPKEGGVVSWFTGKINYENIANGLNSLANEKVVNFFNVVSALTQAGFDNAKLLFDTLAEMKSLPKEGGVAGWFTGKINYQKIAEGLGHLSGEGVKNFFTMAGELDAKVFDNVKLLFDSLSNIKLPKEDNWWDKSFGSETMSFSKIAEDLGTFGETAAGFFEQVNSLNLGNLNGLWDSLSKAETLTASISKVVDDNINDIVEKISKLPQKMGDAIKQSGDTLGTAFVEMWKDAVEASVKPVNKLLSGANHILKEFGSKKRVIEWQPYAKGTDGHKGGNALVNDGRGAELIQMPNGRMFIPNGRNVFLPNAPKGMKVLPAEQTARIMGKSSPSFRYADGIGDIDIWSYYDNGKGLVDKIAESISYDGMSSLASSVGKGIVTTFKGEMAAWVDKLFEQEGGKSLASYVASKGVSQWRSTVIRALKMEGQYSVANVARTMFQMQTESGGNSRAINLWDSNAKKGIPSKGLMQVIDPTFRAYAREGFNKNIYDPLSNILASIRYATSRYGSLSKAYQGHGYSKGVGTVTMPERSVNLNYTPESDSGYYTTNSVEHNTYAPQFTVNISGTSDDRSMYRKIKRMIAEAWNEMLDDLDAKTPQTQQI